MQDSHLSPVQARAQSSRTPNELLDARVYPSSSRMLTNYLADVEQNLDEHRWELALRDVVDLPRIAVALGNPEMRSSRDQCVAWCEQWIRPAEVATLCGDATKARRETGEKIVSAVIPRIVQVCRELAGKES